jgi:polar amino acid transport system permease protein
MKYEWDFGFVLKFQDVLWQGFLGTLKIGVLALAFGSLVGLLLALMRMSRWRALSLPATGFIEFLRITPLMIQLFWIYFALPILVGLKLDAFAAAVITLSVQSGAFFAEVFRGGVQSIDRSQWEGGKALGMTMQQLMRRIILPQAIRRMIPPFMERSFELMKGTTQAATIAYGELLYQSMVLSARLYRPVEILTCVALLYLVMLTMASLAIRYVEHRFEAARS